MLRAEAAVDWRTEPASQATPPMLPSVLMLYYWMWPCQKGSPLAGWKVAS